MLAAILAMCARSFLRADGVALVTAARGADGQTLLHSRYLVSDSGGIILRESSGRFDDPAVVPHVAVELPRGWGLHYDSTEPGGVWGRTPTLTNLLWFDVEWLPAALGGSRYTVRGVRVPYWAPALAIAAPMLLTTLRRRRRDRLRRQRLASGLCPACGYDMRGSDGVCPECGGRT